ncbi:MAG: EF-hand domain-containing protein [Nitrospinae bacterium]|nr:EF-hand domain-containing protein [Nitrospinota bacterium]
MSLVSSIGNPQVVSGASGRGPGYQTLSQAFKQIDSTGAGSITKAQFESAFSSLKMPKALQAMGADAIFTKLDPNNKGSVSKNEFIDGFKKMNTKSQQRQNSAKDQVAANNRAAATSATKDISATALLAIFGVGQPANNNHNDSLINLVA